MDDLVVTNILRFVDQKTLITTCYSVNPQFQRCTRSLIIINVINFTLACQQGNSDLITWFIQHGANDWNSGLRGACLGGHLELVELMILKGANHWNTGLLGSLFRRSSGAS